MKKDLFFMQRALKQANDAANLGEVPVGAVLTLNDEIIAEDHNRSISLNDPSAHAEINVIRRSQIQDLGGRVQKLRPEK